MTDLHLYHQISKRLISLRRDASLSREAAADGANVSQSWLERAEAGRNNISIKNLNKMAEYYNLTLSEFFK